MSAPPFDTGKHTTFTQGPNPAFQWGARVGSTELGRKWLEGEKEGWTGIDTDKEDPMKLYKLMISGITPRPIAFVASRDENGVDNLAPFSWFNMVTASPPLVAFTVARAGGKDKDTAANIKKTGNEGQEGFTVNIISEPFLEQANSCAVDAPAGVSEWDLSGLTKGETKVVKVPRVQESVFSMECVLHEAIDIVHPTTKAHTATHILAYVKYIHVRNDMWAEPSSSTTSGSREERGGTLDLEKFRPVGRAGDISFTRAGDAMRIPRAAWAKEEEVVKKFLESVNGESKM